MTHAPHSSGRWGRGLILQNDSSVVEVHREKELPTTVHELLSASLLREKAQARCNPNECLSPEAAAASSAAAAPPPLHSLCLSDKLKNLTHGETGGPRGGLGGDMLLRHSAVPGPCRLIAVPGDRALDVPMTPTSPSSSSSSSWTCGKSLKIVCAVRLLSSRCIGESEVRQPAKEAVDGASRPMMG